MNRCLTAAEVSARVGFSVSGHMPSEVTGTCRYICYRCMRRRGMTYRAIAKIFSVTHAAVVYGVRMVDNYENLPTPDATLLKAQDIHPCAEKCWDFVIGKTEETEAVAVKDTGNTLADGVYIRGSL